jgi:hypothetical protein
MQGLIQPVLLPCLCFLCLWDLPNPEFDLAGNAAEDTRENCKAFESAEDGRNGRHCSGKFVKKDCTDVDGDDAEAVLKEMKKKSVSVLPT